MVGVSRFQRAECVARSDAWVTSTPNNDVCRIEVTPGSPWPAEQRERGYPLESDGEGTRIMVHGVREVVHINRDGSLAPLVEGSPTRTIDHAGVIAIMAAPMLNRLGALFKGLCWRFIMQGCDYGNGRSAKALLFGQHDLAFQKEAFKERQTTPSLGLRV